MYSCLDKERCNREKSERGRDYSECPSVHAEMNAIISASRKDMIGAEIYIVGIDVETKSYVENPAPCSLCKRLIINSGIDHIFIRTGINDYESGDAKYWKEEDIIGGY